TLEIKRKKPHPFPDAAFFGESRRGSATAPFNPLAEQRKDVLRVRVGDRKRLDRKLLLRLQSLETRRFLVHVSVNQTANALVEGSGKLRSEVFLETDTHGQ